MAPGWWRRLGLTPDRGGHAPVQVRESGPAVREAANGFSGVAHGSVVQAAVVRGDVHVHGSPPSYSAPRQLPFGTRYFVGRHADLGGLSEHLREAMACVVHGMAGVGKTALAIRWAERMADQFPDGQLYVDLHGFDSSAPADPAEALHGFLLALGVPASSIPPGTDARAAAYRSAVADRRLLIVLDNVRDSAHVAPLLPASSSCKLLITSRHRLEGLSVREGIPHITLGLLTLEDAHAFLDARLGAERVAAEPAAVAELIAACARLPLALSIVTARAAVQTELRVEQINEGLRDEHSRLDTLNLGETEADLRAAFSWSLRALAQDEVHLFKLTGLPHGRDIGLAGAASLSGFDMATTRSALQRLTAACLLEEHAPGRFRSHDLLRVYASELVNDEPERDRYEALLRLLDHYLHTGLVANRHLARYRQVISVDPPGPDVVVPPIADLAAATTWFIDEESNLLAAVGDAVRLRLDGHAWRIPWVLTTFLYRYGHWRSLITAQTAAAEAAARLGDTTAQARAHRDIGRTNLRLGLYEEAKNHHLEALRLCVDSGDIRSQAHGHYAVSLVHDRLGEYDLALTHAQQALELYQTEENPAWRAAGLNRVGAAFSMVGNHSSALSLCEEALELLISLGDRYYEAHARSSIGFIHYQMGSIDEAIADCGAALALWREFGNRFEEAVTLSRLGAAYRSQGDPDAARRAWQSALDIFEDLGHREAGPVREELSDLDGEPEC